MKYLITENRIHNLIEKYILDRYPMVGSVGFGTKKVHLAAGPNDEGETDIVKTLIFINFTNGKMSHSPSYTLKKIYNDLNSMFNLNIERYGSYWDISGIVL